MEELERQIREYIENHDVCTIAVADGKKPSAHTVYYVSHDLHIYFESDPQSQKIHILRTNSQISLTIDEDYEDWREIREIQMFGRAKITDKQDAPKLRGISAKKFPHINDLGGIPSHHVFVEVIPERIYLMDFSKGFGHKDIYYRKGDVSRIRW